MRMIDNLYGISGAINVCGISGSIEENGGMFADTFSQCDNCPDWNGTICMSDCHGCEDWGSDNG